MTKMAVSGSGSNSQRYGSGSASKCQGSATLQERLHPSKKSIIHTSVVDPELLSPDPNPTFQVVSDPDTFKPGQLTISEFKTYVMGLRLSKKPS